MARVRGLIAAGDTPATSAINVEEIVCAMRDPEADVVDRLLAGLVVLPVDCGPG